MSIVVFWIDPNKIEYGDGSSCQEFNDDELGKALSFTEELRKAKCRHVVISSELGSQVGGNGCTAVEDGKLPDGSNYSWTKRRHNERPKEPEAPKVCHHCNGTGLMEGLDTYGGSATWETCWCQFTDKPNE
jgi:hypothetical protein